MAKAEATSIEPRVTRVLFRSLVGFSVGLGIYLAIVRVIYDWHLVEKILTTLAMPPGLLALVMLFGGVVFASSGCRRSAWAMLCLTLFYSVLSNSVTANWLGHTLEGRYVALDPAAAQPYDAVVVLGGGAKIDADGNVGVGGAGDRLVTAARLFHEGKATHLIATGSSYEWSAGADYSAATVLIWQQLGIPTSAITTATGVNTSQEMNSLRQLFDQAALPFPKDGRIGLLTSAMHLPRAERLARTAGLTFVPVAVDFQTPLDHPLPLGVIPNSLAIQVINSAAKEYLARLVGR